eukprot:scaffold374_cov271-Pinguiococcus_pyrenoidosus.AAC.15
MTSSSRRERKQRMRARSKSSAQKPSSLRIIRRSHSSRSPRSLVMGWKLSSSSRQPARCSPFALRLGCYTNPTGAAPALLSARIARIAVCNAMLLRRRLAASRRTSTRIVQERSGWTRWTVLWPSQTCLSTAAGPPKPLE